MQNVRIEESKLTKTTPRPLIGVTPRPKDTPGAPKLKDLLGGPKQNLSGQKEEDV